MASYTRQQLEDWIKSKVVHGRVLDIGGSQLPVQGRVQKTERTTFEIMDLVEPHEVKQAPDYTLDLNNEIDRTQFASLARAFDYVACLEVSEYWYDPITALKNIAWMMQEGATLYISFHFVYPVHSPAKYDYLRYTRNGAIKLLETAGFHVAEVTPRKSNGESLQILSNQESMRPAREYKYHDEVGVLIVAKKKS